MESTRYAAGSGTDNLTCADDDADECVAWPSKCSSAPQQTDEAQRRLTRVINGCLDDMPQLQSKIVRIFTSSTFTGQILSYMLLDHATTRSLLRGSYSQPIIA